MRNFFPVELLSHPVVAQCVVLEHIPSHQNFLLKLRIELVNQSVLFTRERWQHGVRHYSFHWQHTDDNALVRWDNASHYPKLASFPHHKHDYRSGSEIVTDSYDITLSEVLIYIQRQLTHPHP